MSNKGHKVFLEEFNCFGLEFEASLNFKSQEGLEGFLHLLPVDVLNKFLTSQLEAENYEAAEIIEEQIKLKK